MKKNKYFVLISAAILTFCLSGCGDTEHSGPPVNSPGLVASNDAGAPAPGGAGLATAQVQLRFTGNGNTAEKDFSSTGATGVQAGDTSANPRRFVARVSLPTRQGGVRAFEVGLPAPSSSLAVGSTYMAGTALVSASYVETVQNQPSSGKIFRAASGGLTVFSLTRGEGQTSVGLRFDDLEMRAQGLAATGSFRVTGQATFTF